MQRIFEKFGFVGLCLAGALVGACSDAPTVPRARPGGPETATQLTGITATACQYGGEYPDCDPKPVDPDGGGVDPLAPAGGGSGGTSSSTCNPTTDPKCEQELTSQDSALLTIVLTQYVRPDTAIRDTTIRRECSQMVAKFRERMAAGKVFRGAYDTQGTNDAHYGATYDGHIHFDPWALAEAQKGVSGALRELINTALHEAAHTMGFLHPHEFDANGHYSDRPFNLLDPGPNQCLR
jgi:hypothetical protein